jgi:hypothetical protein
VATPSLVLALARLGGDRVAQAIELASPFCPALFVDGNVGADPEAEWWVRIGARKVCVCGRG